MATDPATDDDTIQLDLDPVPSGDPGFPPWLATLIYAIGAIVPLPADLAFETLKALCAPYAPGGALRPLVESLAPHYRAAMVAAKDAKLTAINASKAPRLTIVPSAPVALSEMAARQSIPVVREEAAPVAAPSLVSPMVHPGRWTPLMVDPSTRSGHRLQSGAERARKVSPEAWGARIEHAPGAFEGAGSVCRLTSSNGRRSSVHVVTAIVTTDGLTTIGVVRAATDADTAPRAMAVGSAPLVAPRIERESTTTTIGDTTIEGSLDRVTDEGRAIAAPRIESAIVEPTTRGNGTTSEAPIATNTPTGPNVFEQARIARGLAPDARLAPVAVPARVAPTVERPTTERQRLLTERNLITGAVAMRDGWLQVSWTGEGSTTHGAATDALIAVGREGDAEISVPSAVHYAGDAVRVLAGRDWDVKRLSKGQCPPGVKACWMVGRALGGGGRTAMPGDSYGTAELFVDLVGGSDSSSDDGVLKFRGSPMLADQVRTAYSGMVAAITLTSKVMTPWLGQVLRTRHGAVKRGHCWYVPPGHAMAVRALIGGPNYAAACATIIEAGDEETQLPEFDTGSIGALWGDHELAAVTTGADLYASLCRGLTVEAGRIAAELVLKTTEARENASEKAIEKASKIHNATAEYIAAQGSAAYNRATIGALTAARMLRDLGSVAARVAGYDAVLGERSVVSVKAQIATLRATLEPLCDDTSLRGAMLELS